MSSSLQPRRMSLESGPQTALGSSDNPSRCSADIAADTPTRRGIPGRQCGLEPYPTTHRGYKSADASPTPHAVVDPHLLVRPLPRSSPPPLALSLGPPLPLPPALPAAGASPTSHAVGDTPLLVGPLMHPSPPALALFCLVPSLRPPLPLSPAWLAAVAESSQSFPALLFLSPPAR